MELSGFLWCRSQALYDCCKPINTHSATLAHGAHEDDDEDVCDNDDQKNVLRCHPPQSY